MLQRGAVAEARARLVPVHQRLRGIVPGPISQVLRGQSGPLARRLGAFVGIT